jgi:phosphoadenosine phosphosulfate reductase
MINRRARKRGMPMRQPQEVAMSRVKELQEITREMDTVRFLRFLISERFPNKTLASCSLRARSIVLLKMISEIDVSTPIVFCHAPELYPESLEYRTKLVDRLSLRDIREPADDELGPLPGDCHHSEGLWAENPVDHTRVYKIVSLNRTLANFDCWISSVYHGPYTATSAPRVSEEGRLIRINPLGSWTQDQVRRFMKENGLPYHPRSMLRSGERAKEESQTFPTYHY